MTDPFVGQLAYFRVYSGVVESGSGLQRHPSAARSASDACSRCTPTSVRRSEGRSRRATSPRRSASRTSGRATRSATRSTRSSSSRSASRSRSSRCRSSRRPRTDQEKLGVALGKLQAGGSDLPGPHRPRHRPDLHLRHGRAAPRDHHRPPAARVQRRRQYRTAAGRLQGVDHPRGRGRWSLRPAVVVAAVSTATPRFACGRRPKEADFVFNNKIVGGAIPREFIKPIEQGHPRGDGNRARSPATRSPASKSTSTTEASTTWTPPRWPSRSPARWRSKDACEEAEAGLARAGDGRSRWSPPRTTWAT